MYDLILVESPAYFGVLLFRLAIARLLLVYSCRLGLPTMYVIDKVRKNVSRMVMVFRGDGTVLVCVLSIATGRRSTESRCSKRCETSQLCERSCAYKYMAEQNMVPRALHRVQKKHKILLPRVAHFKSGLWLGLGCRAVW